MDTLTHSPKQIQSKHHLFDDSIEQFTIKRSDDLLTALLDPNFIPPPRPPEKKRTKPKQLPAPPSDIAQKALMRNANHAEKLRVEFTTLVRKKLSREQMTSAETNRYQYLQKILKSEGV